MLGSHSAQCCAARTSSSAPPAGGWRSSSTKTGRSCWPVRPPRWARASAHPTPPCCAPIQTLGFASLADLKSAILKSRLGLDAGRRHAADPGQSGKGDRTRPRRDPAGACRRSGRPAIGEMPRPDGCSGPRAGWRRAHRRLRDRAVGGACDLCFDAAGAKRPPQPHDQCDGLHAGRSTCSISPREMCCSSWPMAACTGK